MKAAPDWQLPPGVSRGTWESFQQANWAGEEDRFLEKTPLIALDQRFVDEMFPAPPGRIVDLGCGAGRTSLQLARRGFTVTAVDLSQPMLDHVQAAAQSQQLSIECLQANLVELGAIAEGAFSGAVCLFSTLGMIRGHAHRLAALREFRRILAPGGKLALHAHQFWWNLRQYGGPAWMARHALDVLRKKVEWGDRFAAYRGVPNFYLHSFRAAELRGLLKSAGFRILAWRPLTGEGAAYLKSPGVFPALRCGGWLMACERPADP